MLGCQFVVEAASHAVRVQSIRGRKEIVGAYAVAIVGLTDRGERKNLCNGRILRKAGEIIRICRIREVHRRPAAVDWIDECEPASLECGRRRGLRGCAGSAEPLCLTIEEKESMILPSRSAEGSPKVVSDIGILWTVCLGIEEVARAKCVVASKFIGVAVKGIGTPTGHHVNNRTGVSTEFRIEVVGYHAKFLGRIGIRRGDSPQSTGNRGIVVVGAVEQKVIVAIALA